MKLLIALLILLGGFILMILALPTKIDKIPMGFQSGNLEDEEMFI